MKRPWDLNGREFCEYLFQYKLENHPFRTHPFFLEWQAGKLPLEVIRRWAPQFYAWLACIPRAYALRFARLPWTPEFAKYRSMLLEHLTEEAGFPEGQHTPHPELFLRFCEGLGLSREDVETADLLPGTHLAIDDFLYINHEEPFYVSAAGSSEPPNVELCEKLLPVLRTVYKIPERNLEYYRLHGEADKEHSVLVNSLVADFADRGPEVRLRMWQAMLRGFGVHRAIVDGVWSVPTHLSSAPVARTVPR
jgi:pyrroloquinoline-quinone synthase